MRRLLQLLPLLLLSRLLLSWLEGVLWLQLVEDADVGGVDLGVLVAVVEVDVEVALCDFAREKEVGRL
jgi:hypothetical protein